jgi:hypothetical protein
MSRFVSWREECAFHEAGHAVMAVLHNRILGEVSIDPSTERGTVGHVEHYLTENRVEKTRRSRSGREGFVMAEIMIAYAGHLASGIRTGLIAPHGAQKDLALASELSAMVYEDEGTRNAFENLLWHQTRTTLQEPIKWAAVVALAHVLLAEGTVPGRRARRLIKMVLLPPAVDLYEWREGVELPLGVRAPEFLSQAIEENPGAQQPQLSATADEGTAVAGRPAGGMSGQRYSG